MTDCSTGGSTGAAPGDDGGALPPEALDEAISSVVHELRNPLSAVMMNAELLETLERPADVQAAAARIRAGSRELAARMEGVLMLWGLGHGSVSPTPVDLARRAQQIAAQIDARHPERRVEWRIGAGMQAYVDPVLADLLLENLLGNAHKFTGDVPIAHIDVTCTEPAPGSRFVELVVADDGAGLDAGSADRLFRPFVRAHGRHYPGSGLGLAIVARIARLHGGWVRAEGSSGSGALFRVGLPAVTTTGGDTHRPAPGKHACRLARRGRDTLHRTLRDVVDARAV